MFHNVHFPISENARVLSAHPPSPKRATFDQSGNNNSSNRVSSSSRKPLSVLSSSHNHAAKLPTTAQSAQFRQPVSTVRPYVPPKLSPVASRLQPSTLDNDPMDDDLDLAQLDALESQVNRIIIQFNIHCFPFFSVA